jgi:hypothetical protein
MTEHKVNPEQINYRGHIIKVGHPVRILPTKKGGRDGYDSLVKTFHGTVTVDDDAGTRKTRVTGISVTDPNNGATRTFTPDRVVPYLRSVETKAAALKERKKVVPITKAKKTTTKATASPRQASS